MKFLRAAVGCVFFVIVVFVIPQTLAEFRYEDFDWTRFKDHAEWASKILINSKKLMETAPKTVKLIKGLATNVKKVVATVSPAFAVATLYFTAVVAVSYYYSVEAQEQLLKAHFKKDGLRIVIDTKIIPILAFLEELHNNGDMESFCKAKSELETRFGNALTSLQAIRKDIEHQMLDSKSAAERNKVLQLVCAVGGVASVVAFPLGAPIAASAIGLSTSVAGFGFGYNNTMTLEYTMELLNVTRLEALEVEKACERAKTDAEIFCIEHLQFPVKQLELLKEAYVSMKIVKERLQ